MCNLWIVLDKPGFEHFIDTAINKTISADHEDWIRMCLAEILKTGLIVESKGRLR